MKWALVFFVFQINAEGNMEDATSGYRVFDTQAECDDAGEHFREHVSLPETTQSVSTCLPENIFEQSSTGS